MKTIGLDSIGNAETRTLAGGTVIAIVDAVARTIVCDDIVPADMDPQNDHEDFYMESAHETGRCRARLVRFDDAGWACERGHGWDDSMSLHGPHGAENLAEWERDLEAELIASGERI